VLHVEVELLINALTVEVDFRSFRLRNKSGVRPPQ